MKVLYLIDTLEGYGAEKSLVQIALNLKQNTPVFVHIFKGDKLKPFLDHAGVKVYSLNLDSTETYKKALQRMELILEEEKPDILHATLFRAEIFARKLKQRYPKLQLVGSFVSNSYGKQCYKHLSPILKLKLFLTQLWDRSTIGHVDFFICNSEAIKKTNRRALGVPRNKIKVIYRGRSFNKQSSPSQMENTLRNEFDLKDQKIFLNVGRLHDGKGQIDLLLAFKKMNAIHPRTILFIVGEGSLRRELETRIAAMHMEKIVFLLGYRDDVRELLEMADFFVFPSYYEGLPGALIEAIIAKTPAIVSNIPENKECFPPDGALYFPPGDVNALCAKMEEALYLKDWKRRTEQSYENAAEKFDILKISAEYDAFYNEITKHIALI